MRSRGGRLALALLGLALAPSALFAWMGWQAIEIEARDARRNAERRAQRALEQVDKDLAERLGRLRRQLALELRALSDAGLTDLRGLSDGLALYRDRVSGYGLAFAVSDDDAWSSPGLPPRRIAPAPSEDERAAFALLAEESEEAREQGDWSWARSLLLEARGVLESELLRAQAELLLAEVAGEQGLEELEAEHIDRALAAWPGLAPTGDRGFVSEALSRRLELPAPLGATAERAAQALAFDLWGLERSERVLLWEALDARSQGQHARLWEFAEVFETRAIAEIRRSLEDPELIDEARPAWSQPQLVEVRAFGRAQLFLAAALSHEPLPAFVGLEVDLDELAEDLRASLRDLTRPYRARVVVSQDGEVIAGDETILEASAGRPLLSVPSWLIEVAPEDPGEPGRIARRRRWMYALTVGTCLLIALVGGALTVRSVDREVALARTRTTLVRNVSHELRTPVASFRMLAEMLEDGDLPAARAGEFHRRIAREARRLGRMVESVLSLSRIEAGAWQLDLAPAAFAPAIEGCVAAFRESEEGREAELRVIDESQGAWARLDREALELILTNLLSNAVKYGEGRAVEVGIAAEARQVELSVRDYGRGMSAEARGQLFTPFYRERPGDGEVRGVGIGLSIVGQLLRLMGGDIAVEGGFRDGGTLFRVRLPRVPEGGA